MLWRPREEFSLSVLSPSTYVGHVCDSFPFRIKTCTNMVRHVKYMHIFSFLVDAVFNRHFKAPPVIGSEIVVFEESDWSFAAIQDLLSHHLIL